MTPERWAKIEELFQAAVARPLEKRAAFLEKACDGDDSLRRKVAALLASDRVKKAYLGGCSMTRAPSSRRLRRSIRASGARVFHRDR